MKLNKGHYFFVENILFHKYLINKYIITIFAIYGKKICYF